ncbi:DUF4232 domain-containing protein [Kineosporia sp. J2-2]|uniref:DUF4232 domain-containing protein n=1 Tax=Kineosporia corallincola TaxID=2835133 RepID=A0ABS5TB78_9ACTN|nr:DUF4232 domain-containing protein [Kineosporia corallincola]MBT0768098.1 DUF4232 domain-containing protein [Kineosporia corallincola]
MSLSRRSVARPGFLFVASAALAAGCVNPPAQAGSRYAPEPTPTPFGTPTSVVGACPDSGLIASVGVHDAAMGWRGTQLVVSNCGSGTATVSGYPTLIPLDEWEVPLDATLKHGEQSPDGPVARAETFRLKPGESVDSWLTWRNTVDPVQGDRAATAVGYRLEVAGQDGVVVQSQTFADTVDIGSAGLLYVSAWERAE